MKKISIFETIEQKKAVPSRNSKSFYNIVLVDYKDKVFCNTTKG